MVCAKVRERERERERERVTEIHTQRKRESRQSYLFELQPTATILKLLQIWIEASTHNVLPRFL